MSSSLTQGDYRQTPEWLLVECRKAMGVEQFDLDPFTAHDNPTKAKRFLTEKDDAFVANWREGFPLGQRLNVFGNFPFSLMHRVIERTLQQLPLAARDNIILVGPSKTEQPWFQDWAHCFNLVCFISGRVAYRNPNGTKDNSPRWGSVLLCRFGTDPETQRAQEVLSEIGTCFRRW